MKFGLFILTFLLFQNLGLSANIGLGKKFSFMLSQKDLSGILISSVEPNFELLESSDENITITGILLSNNNKKLKKFEKNTTVITSDGLANVYLGTFDNPSYDCRISRENGIITNLKGECLMDIKIYLPYNLKVKVVYGDELVGTPKTSEANCLDEYQNVKAVELRGTVHNISELWPDPSSINARLVLLDEIGETLGIYPVDSFNLERKKGTANTLRNHKLRVAQEIADKNSYRESTEKYRNREILLPEHELVFDIKGFEGKAISDLLGKFSVNLAPKFPMNYTMFHTNDKNLIITTPSNRVGDFQLGGLGFFNDITPNYSAFFLLTKRTTKVDPSSSRARYFLDNQQNWPDRVKVNRLGCHNFNAIIN
jgi:hypothetical protein